MEAVPRRLGAVMVVAMATVTLTGGCAKDVRRVDLPTAPLPMLPSVSSPAPGTRPLPWQLEGTPGPGRQIVISVPGAECRKPTGVHVSETPQTVTVTVWGVLSSCPAGAGRDSTVYGVGLPEPLGVRRLIHGESRG